MSRHGVNVRHPVLARPRSRVQETRTLFGSPLFLAHNWMQRLVPRQHLGELGDAARPRFRLYRSLNAKQHGIPVLRLERGEKLGCARVLAESGFQVRRHLRLATES